MKNLATILAVLIALMTVESCTPPGANAVSQAEPDTTYNFVTGHAPVWEGAISQVLALIDSMPSDQLTYRPNEGIRTFAEQIGHIAGSSKVIANLFLKDVPPPEEKPVIDFNAMSKEELKSTAESLLKETWTIMESMSDQELEQKIKSFAGNEMTRLEGLLLVHDHLTNHKAKANLYIRLVGANPPKYGYY